MATYEENQQYAKLMIWHTRDGRQMNIEDMTLTHLYNVLGNIDRDWRLEPYRQAIETEIKVKEAKKAGRTPIPKKVVSYTKADETGDVKKVDLIEKRGYKNYKSADGTLSVRIPSGELAGRIRSYCKTRDISLKTFAETAFQRYFDNIADEQFDEAKAQLDKLTAGLTEEQKKLLASQIIGG